MTSSTTVSDSNTNIVAQPEVRAARVDLLVPRPELIERDARLVIDRPAGIPVLDQMEGLAVANDPGHLGCGLVSRLRWLRCRRGGTGRVDADVVV